MEPPSEALKRVVLRMGASGWFVKAQSNFEAIVAG